MEVAVFREYLSDALHAKLRETRGGLQRTIVDSIQPVSEFERRPKLQLSAGEKHNQRRAQDVVDARVQLLAALDRAELGLDAKPFGDDAKRTPLGIASLVNTDALTRDVPAALARLNAPQFLDPTIPSAGIGDLSLAFAGDLPFATFLEDEVENPIPGRPPIRTKVRGNGAILPGFPASGRLDGEEISQLKELFVFLAGGAERHFRFGIMRGALQLAAGEPEGAINDYAGLFANVVMDDTRRMAVAIREAFAELAQGDAVYRKAVRSDDPRRVRAKEHYAAAVARLDEHAVSADEPQRAQIEQHARMQTAKIDAGFNVLGYRDDYVPAQRPAALEQLALRHLDAAQDSIDRFEKFTQTATLLQDALRELEFESDIKAHEMSIADADVRNAQDHVAIADARETQIREQIDGVLVSQAVELGNVMVGAAASLAVGAAIGSAQAVGSAVTGIVGVLSGGASATASYQARLDELKLQRTIARVERRIADRNVAIAEDRRRILTATIDFMGAQVRRIQERELNADLYFAAAEEFRAMAVRHLDAAITWAYLFERAVIFLRLEQIPDNHRVPFDYGTGPGGLLTAPAAIRSSLAFVAALNVPLTRFQVLQETYSLRSLFPVEFNEFQRTGRMNFALSLYELSKRRPGVHRQRIKRVDVELQFPPPSGYTGRIRHGGAFLLRDMDSTMRPETQTFLPSEQELQRALDAVGAGASQGSAVGGVIPFVLDEGTIELSPDSKPPDLSDPDPDALLPIEGYGPAGNWTLEIENVDLRFITDARLRITYVIPESRELLATRVRTLLAAHEADVLLPGDTRDLISSILLRKQFPDTFAQLASGEAQLVIEERHLPSGIGALRLKTVVVRALDAENVGIEGFSFELVRPGTEFRLQRTTRPDGFSEDLTVELPELASDVRPDLAGTYLLRLPDPAQLQAIGDLLFILVFDFQEAST